MERTAHLGLDPWAAEGRPSLRRCDHPDCAEEGLYRAPKARDRLTEYFWFCLGHVREYNRGWDYFAGMNEREIEGIRRRDTIWERPTWRLGGAEPYRMRIDPQKVRDFFGLFEEDRRTEKQAEPPPRRPATPEDEAFAVFDLENSATLVQIKARYKELVKRHHPDTNGGDKAAEERLKVINQAYTTLKNSVLA
jgi:hypothetical protein